MAKSPKTIKTAAPAFLPVDEVISRIASADGKAHAGIISAKATLLSDIIAAIKGNVAPITKEVWVAQWSAPVKAMLTAAKNPDGSNRYNSDATISVTLSGFRNVFMALSHVPAGANEHALLPTPAETSFDLFWRGVRPRLSEAGLLDAVAPRAPSASKADQIKALKEQVAKAEATAKAATAHVSDNAQPAAKVTDEAKATADLLAKTSAVDLMIGLLRSMNTNCTPEDAKIVMTAMRKNYTMAMSFLKTIAAADPA